MQEPVATALVVGGGIVGLSCALRLQRAGIATQLADPDAELRAASWNCAGHIAIEQVEPLPSWSTLSSVPSRLFSFGGALDVNWRNTDVRHWLKHFVAAAKPANFDKGKQALAPLLACASSAWRTLATDIHRPNIFAERGHIVVWESAATAKAGRAAWLDTDIGGATLRDCTAQELQAIAHQVKRPIAGGVRFAKTGQVVDLPELFQALHAAFAAAGGQWLREPVASLAHEHGRAQAVFGNGNRSEVDLIVVSAGARSKALMKGVGHDVPLLAERGYHLQVPASQAQGWWPDLPPVVFEDRSMIVTRFAPALRACSFVELADVDAPTDPRKWRRLQRHVSELGLPFGDAPSQWMGARPTLPDYVPAIGRSTRAPNLIYAFGHQHLGLTLGPLTGEIVLALALNAEPPLSLTPFNVERFS